jgi:4-amino-4-deoxy-L-arabinose transferase-like glycosyltransferase
MGVSPDSYYHLRVSQAYSTTLGIPSNTPQTYKWRDITRIPYLYFWVNGRVLNINDGVIDEVVLLRIINIIYSLGTVYVMYLLSKEIFKDKWKRVFPVFFLTHTLMFVFLSSSINYDNLANLLSTLSIYFFVKFVKKEGIDLKYLLLMLLSLCIGALTKTTVLPVSLVLVILSAVEVTKRKGKVKKIKAGKELLLLIPVAIFVFLNLSLYGGNLLKYKSLEPSCTQILTHEQCLENGVYYRNKVDYNATPIDGPLDVFNMIVKGERIGPVRYFFKWFPDLMSKIFGIMGDNSLYLPSYLTALFIFFFLAGVVLLISNKKKLTKIDKYLITILLFYTAILFFTQNYSMYLTYNHYYLGLQGRYIFPVISIIYILLTKSFFFIKPKKLGNILLISFSILLIYSCNIYLFLNLPNSWLK